MNQEDLYSEKIGEVGREKCSCTDGFVQWMHSLNATYVPDFERVSRPPGRPQLAVGTMKRGTRAFDGMIRRMYTLSRARHACLRSLF